MNETGPSPETGKRAVPDRWLFAVPVICYCCLVHRFWFVTDDAFISFRYARNWAEGAGLRFNLGVDPPVEGFSNFLWTALMAGIHGLGLDMVGLACWISFFLGLILLWIVNRRLVALHGPGNAAAFLGTLFLACFPPFAVWSTGGLETMLFALLLFTAYANLPGSIGEPRGLLAGLAAGLLALTRPEGIIWGLALAGLHLLRRGPEKERAVDRAFVRYLALLLSMTAIFLAARLLYFEKALPNTAYAKVGFSLEILERGLLYLANFSLTFATPALLILLLPLLWFQRKHDRSIVPAAVVIGGFAAYSIASGGDFMAMGRFLAPAAPFFAILFAALFAALTRRGRAPLKPLSALAALLLAIQALPAFDLCLIPAGLQRALDFRWNDEEIRSEAAQWAYMNENMKKWAASGRALKEYASEDDSLVCANIGAIGYYSDLLILDQCGLVEPDVDQWQPIPGMTRKSAGHDKMRPLGYFLGRSPTFFQAVVFNSDEEVRQFVAFCRNQGVPPGYGVRAIRLDDFDDALEGATLTLIAKRQSTAFKRLPRPLQPATGNQFMKARDKNRR